MLNINMPGIFMFVLGGVVAGIGLWLRVPDVFVMLAIGAALVLADLIWRARSFGSAGWLTNRAFGGSLSILPMWAVGLIVLTINAVRMLA
ncbi:MAG: hypothetical protein JNL73_11210 [Anaerolineales bacterium]|nr:hypothetical protein [Anaerolineales bacterium]